MQRKTKITINGNDYENIISGHQTLLEYIRNILGLTGSKESCGTGDCGSCSMITDAKVVKPCLILAVEMDGKSITTIEGLAAEGTIHPLQTSFAKNWGTQCGYCTPGFIMSAKALLDQTPNPSDEEIKHATAGNLCRCTGYVKIVDSIREAARVLQGKEDNYAG